MFMYHCQTTKVDSYVQAAFNWRVESETFCVHRKKVLPHQAPFLWFATIQQEYYPNADVHVASAQPSSLQVRSREIFPRSGLVSNWINAGLVWEEQLSASIRRNERVFPKRISKSKSKEVLDYPNKQETATFGLEVYDTSRKLPICKAASLKPNQSNLEILAFSPLVWLSHLFSTKNGMHFLFQKFLDPARSTRNVVGLIKIEKKGI